MSAEIPAPPLYNLLMFSGDTSVARGIDGAFSAMLARFRRYWARIDILTPTAPSATARQLYENVYVHPAPHSRILQPLFIWHKGRELLAERPYHLATSHDYGFFYNGIGAWYLLSGTAIPYVSEIHHIEGYPIAVNLRERLWRWVASRYIPFVAKHAAAIRVVNAAQVPAYLHRLGVPSERILVLPSLYIDASTLRMPEEAQPELDMLFVGRLTANKGIETILHAVRRLRQYHPRILLGIRGDGPLKAQLEQFIARHGLIPHVRWLAPVPAAELASLYASARMLVCASTVEGGPRVTVEAMACGVPVLTTPVGIMPEIITSGDNGIIFRTVEDLVAHAHYLLNDETRRREIGQAGQATARRFEADAVIERYALAYHRLIEQRIRPA